MTAPATGAFYLGSGADAAFARFHPSADDAPGVAVLLCPPFGWDDVCSHRARRTWAMRLAEQGRPALRLDLPSAGDAGGTPYDPDRLGAWTGRVTDAAAWLRHQTGGARVVAIGIGLGGLLAWRAAAAGAEIDDLVLWAVPPRGKALLRELRAFARLEQAETPEGIPSPLPDGTLLSGGFAIAPETIAALQAVDLAALPLPPREPRRHVLLLGRDGVGADALAEVARAAGAEVEVDSGAGYGPMMVKPDESRPPWATFARVDRWLAGVPAAPTRTATDRDAPPASDELQVGDGIVERPIVLPTAVAELPAVLTEAGRDTEDHGLVLVLLNAAAVPRLGPNRLWVTAARRAAAQGVPAVRLDFAGCGDADGDDTRWPDALTFYTDAFRKQLRGAFDTLVQRGIGQRFLVAGLCSGGYWAFGIGLADERVVAAVAVNPGLLVLAPELEIQRQTRKLRKLLRPAIWRKILRGHFGRQDALGIVRALVLRPVRALAARLRLLGPEAPAPAPSLAERVDAELDALRDRGVRLHLVLSADEPVKDELRAGGQLDRLARWPNTTVALLPGVNRAHTLRPAQLQHAMLQELEAVVAEQRDAARGPAAPVR